MATMPLLVFVSTLALALALSASPTSATERRLAEGAACYWDKNYMPASPTCEQPFQCVVTQVLPASNEKLFKGVCVDDSYNSNDYCIYQSVSYAVGATGITANFACPNCTCSRAPGATRASCECAPGPACRVDGVGKAVGSACSGRQSQCVINSVRKGTNVGTCTSPALSAGQCVTAGPGWGPIFYSSGMASGAVKAGDLCKRCACSSGQFTNCKRIKGCKMCVPQAGAGGVKEQCATCCKGAQGDANVQACLVACGMVRL
ncbi:hypothetical protein CLOM_g2273 [Closterium sp. NIES-68]|nr:hypothetical protein CLOM_g2273 [Closterium sp. NIES-68]GJP84075.1 hypothetical protein CLOP_g14165 [Closterium sp. NIES-67]